VGLVCAIPENEHSHLAQMDLEIVPRGQCPMVSYYPCQVCRCVRYFRRIRGGRVTILEKRTQNQTFFFKLGAKHMVCDGKRTKFWLDLWVGRRPLRDSFPTLFSICDNQQLLVTSACEEPRGSVFVDLLT
jgi:hypothetical protein